MQTLLVVMLSEAKHLRFAPDAALRFFARTGSE